MKLNEIQLRKLITNVINETPKKKKPQQKKVLASSIRKKIVDALSPLGYKVSDMEKDAGRLKAWMRVVDAKTEKQPLKVFKKALEKSGFKIFHVDSDDGTISGDNFVVHVMGLQYELGADIFIEVYTGARSEEARHGIDTMDLGESIKYTNHKNENGYRVGGSAEGTMEEIEAEIAEMNPNDYSDFDYVDTDTGEIYLSLGRAARSSEFHPQYEIDLAQRRAENEERHREQYRLEDEEYKKEDEEWEDKKRTDFDLMEKEYKNAIRRFADDWTGYSLEETGVSAEDAASDAASSFFYQFPEWKNWARQLQITKQDIHSAVTDWVYHAMTTGIVAESKKLRTNLVARHHNRRRRC